MNATLDKAIEVLRAAGRPVLVEDDGTYTVSAMADCNRLRRAATADGVGPVTVHVRADAVDAVDAVDDQAEPFDAGAAKAALDAAEAAVTPAFATVDATLFGAMVRDPMVSLVLPEGIPAQCRMSDLGRLASLFSEIRRHQYVADAAALAAACATCEAERLSAMADLSVMARRPNVSAAEITAVAERVRDVPDWHASYGRAHAAAEKAAAELAAATAATK